MAERQCYVCHKAIGPTDSVELARCDVCSEEAFLCGDCDTLLKPGMRTSAAKLWEARHIHLEDLRAHLKEAQRRLGLALDSLHEVRIELDRGGRWLESRRLSLAIRPLETLHSDIKQVATSAATH